MAAIFFVNEIYNIHERRRERIYRSPYVSAFSLHAIEFKQLFRLPKHEVRNLCLTLREELQPVSEIGTTLSVEAKVLCALRFFATGSYQRSVGQDITLTLSQSSVSRCVTSVSKAINKVLLHKYVTFPKERDYPTIKQNFANIGGFPGIVGIIDCTQIAIIAPPENDPAHPEYAYLNRKGFHSLNVQLVCDADMRITNVNSKFPGRTHDSFIWRNSILRSILLDEASSNTHGWLLGDSGYPLEPWLLTPVAHVNATPAEAAYNHAHAKTRSIIERCNGLLKARFRYLHKHRVLHYSPTTAAYIINACVVLHNICIDARIPAPEFEEMEGTADESTFGINLSTQSASYRAALLLRQRLIDDRFSA